MRINCFCGGFPIAGFENLDKMYGWIAQNGFEYEDNSVEGITMGYGLMYLTDDEIHTFLKECYRVLEPKGVVRIKDDNTTNPNSRVYKTGWPTHVTLTGPEMMLEHLQKAGFEPHLVDSHTTNFKDESLFQNFGAFTKEKPDDTFHVEGIKLCGNIPG
jgi:predicted SAM-dependent methyltransferase